MIERIQKAIDSAIRGESRLPTAAAKVPGMTGMHVRHLLNNLCGEPGTVYLEVGLNEGASFVAALAGNEDGFRNVKIAYGIDNWCGIRRGQYDNDQERTFHQNIAAHLFPGYGGCDGRLAIFKGDLLEVDTDEIAGAVTVFYYDADHEHTQAGIQRFLPCLASPAILLVDDWLRPNVREGTRKAIVQGGFQIIHEWELKADPKNREGTWWQNFFVAAIERMV